MAYKRGAYKEIRLCRFYAPCFWPGIVPEHEDQESLPPDYDYFLNKDAWSEDEIFGLFAQDNSTVLQDSIRCSVRAGKLISCSIEQSVKHRIGDVYYFTPFTVIDWAIGKGLKLPAELLEWHKQESNKSNAELLQAEVVGNDDSDNQDEGRRQKQIDAICGTAKALNYNLLSIPEGGKAAIKDKCLKDTALFTNDGFKRAWVEAGKRNLISMIDKEKYL